MARARCRAPYCAIAEDTGERETKNGHRIMLAVQEREYFRVSCLESVFGLPSLAPQRFKLDVSRHQWNDTGLVPGA